MKAVGPINLLHFLGRRIRRIVPALFFVLISCTFLAYDILLPVDFTQFAQSGLATVAFVSNFFFLFVNTSYDADASLLHPLLHMWSLGIEGQFYIIIPFLILFIWRKAKAHYHSIFLILISSSLLFADLTSARDVDFAFYFPLSRFWELLFGGYIAFLTAQRPLTKFPWTEHALPYIGILMIAVSLYQFGADTRHPSIFLQYL